MEAVDREQQMRWKSKEPIVRIKINYLSYDENPFIYELCRFLDPTSKKDFLSTHAEKRLSIMNEEDEAGDERRISTQNISQV